MNTWVKYGIYLAGFFLALGAGAYMTVHLVVRSQPEVQVPDLMGQDAVTALKTLSDAGLNLKVEAMDFNQSVPKNHVIRQDPSPGSRLKKSREVRVVLSQGSASVPLPDLRGLTREQALAILKQSRLEPGRISHTYGSGPEQGRNNVLAQAPDPLTAVAPGTRIDLLLSLGPRPYYINMPDLTGRLYSLALMDLERMGLSVGRMEAQTLPEWPADAVVIQVPPPGSRVAKGDLVQLTINRPADARVEEYRFHVLNYDIPYGLLRREIRFRIPVGSYLLDLHDQWHPPGDTVTVVALLPGRPLGQVFEDGREATRFGQEEFL
jgi:beta-lactam-binding protein with PASTA domain